MSVAARAAAATALLALAVFIGTADAEHTPDAPWGGAGTGTGQFTSPLGIASTGDGDVFVADPVANRVQRFTEDGAYVASFAASGPRHLAADGFGSIYVAEPGNGRVQKLTEDGTPVQSLGAPGNGQGQFQAPAGVAVDSVGNVFVTDTATNLVQRFTAEGVFDVWWGGTGTARTQFGSAQDVAVDVFGAVYVVDSALDRVVKFDADGRWLDGWGSRGARDGEFEQPSGIATDGAGNVYVADTGNHRVQMFTPDGAFVESIGDGLLIEPVDVASDRTGAVYVADRGNAQVRRFVAQAPPLPPPQLGRTANVEPVSGSVLVRARGTRRFAPLTRGRQIPVGSLVQATRGVVRLTTASNTTGGQQAARFFAGLFRVTQRRALLPVTEVQLAGGDFSACGPGGSGTVRAASTATAAANKARKRSKHVVRRLWTDGKGRFRARGSRGAGGARGTRWLTEDRCDGTLFRVSRGTVEVRDFVRKRTLIVPAGRSVLIARP